MTEATRTADSEPTMVERMFAIEAEHKRAEREDGLSPTLSCPLGIHGFYQRTPNTLCPWCEWEAAEQRLAELKESLVIRPEQETTT